MHKGLHRVTLPEYTLLQLAAMEGGDQHVESLKKQETNCADLSPHIGGHHRRKAQCLPSTE